MDKSVYDINQTYELLPGRPLEFEDGLQITLKTFSHKRPMIGGPTKATAYLEVCKNSQCDEVTLSLHGIEGKPEVIKYEEKGWREYKFILTDFQYNSSIKISIVK